MTPQDLQTLPSQAADQRLAYGEDSSQYGELWVPTGSDPHPVAVLIHGGCFKAAYATGRDLAPMGDALKEDGIATWNIEYRRLGQPGGGWTGTCLDIGRAVDHLRAISGRHNLDLGCVVVLGTRPAGTWLCGRRRALACRRAGVCICVIRCPCAAWWTLLGGSPAAGPERYAEASPIKLLPLDVPQLLMIGEHEDFVLPPLMEAYAQAAARAGDPVRLVTIPRVGHFEIASPRSTA